VVPAYVNGEMNLKRFTKINAMKIEYKIPESLKEITLGQYQDFLKLKESLEKETIDDFDFMMQSIKIFASGDLTKLEKLPQSKVSEIFEVVMGIFQKETNQLHKVVTIQGKEYGMHSDLLEITTAEFADIQEYQKKGFQDNLHNILAVLYRPIKRKHKHDNEISISPSQPRIDKNDRLLAWTASLDITVKYRKTGCSDSIIVVTNIGAFSPKEFSTAFNIN
jgi:hypothetical protein